MSSACLEEDELLAYLEHATPAAEEHLATCQACRATIRELMRDGREPLSQDAGLAPTLVELASPRGHASIAAGAQLGRYVIAERLGQGGLGVVYAAHDPQLDRKIAIKVMRDPTASAALAAEAQAIARLAHPNVVAVHDLGEHEGRAYVAMELVEGGTLTSWQTAARRTPREIVEMYRRAGEGLAAAHAAGLVHRDFKPSNVLVDLVGRPRVSDFGLAIPSGNAASVRAAGTPAYAAPEATAKTAFDARSDQYSFAVALYEALERKRPETPPRPLRARVPRRIERAIRRGLSPDPTARFPSMHELDRALRWTRRGPMVFAGLLATITVVMLALTYADHEPSDSCARTPTLALSVVEHGMIAARFAQANQGTAGAATLDALERYAKGWTYARASACRALSDTELRYRCLDNRHQEFRLAVASLRAADAGVITGAPDLLASLVDADACTDVANLRLGRVASGGFAVQARVAALREQVLAWRALILAGNHARAQQLQQPILDAVAAIGYQPLTAEAESVAGELAEMRGNTEQAWSRYRAAVLAAESGGDELAAARSWVALARVAALMRSDVTAARDALAHGTALIERLGFPELRARLAAANGDVLQMTGDYRGAIAARDEAVRELSRSSWASPYEILRERINAASVHAMFDSNAAAELDDAIDDLRKVLGATHGLVGQALMMRGMYAFTVYDDARAVELLTEAVPLLEKAYGADSPLTWAAKIELARTQPGAPEQQARRLRELLVQARQERGQDDAIVARTEAALARTEYRAGNYKDALQLARSARASLVRIGGEDSLNVLYVDLTLAHIPRVDDAPGPQGSRVRDLRAVVDHMKKVLGRDSDGTASARRDLGSLLEHLEDNAGAEIELREALRVFREVLARPPAATAELEAQLAFTIFDQGRRTEAVPLFEHALPLITNPAVAAEIREALAAATTKSR
ncbi:MAG TPA: serine/threonine-protein kinase [Kofleriaceae bacterium]|jgi:tetratricopeptide (TPR) repeat protein